MRPAVDVSYRSNLPCQEHGSGRASRHALRPAQVLYKLLCSLSVPEEPEPNSGERVQPGAAALAALEERGCTMLYRMPQWLYDDDE